MPYVITKLENSDRDDKKYMVTLFYRKKGKWEDEVSKPVKVYFGDPDYEDFTIHKDEKRKENYLKRHAATEDWSDPLTPGFWSRWLLWNKPTLQESYNNILYKLKLK